MGRWIKIYDKLLEWEWWDNALMVKLWIYILLSANSKKKKWKGNVIERGQFVTSQLFLAEMLDCSPRYVYKMLKRMVASGNITYIGTNKNTIITICNYDSYQEKNGNVVRTEFRTESEQSSEQSSYQSSERSSDNIRYKNKDNNNPPPACAPAREEISEVFEVGSTTTKIADRPSELGVCARARIPADKVADWLRANGGDQWKEVACMQLRLTMEQLNMAFDEFQRELIAQGVEDKEEQDIRPHFMNMLRIAIRKNKNNGNDQRINSLDDIRECVEVAKRMANTGH